MPSISFNELMTLFFIVLVVLFIAAILVFNFGMKIVPENKRLVLFRLGKCVGSRGPGIVTVIPVIDRGVWVDVQMKFHYEFRDLPTTDGMRISYKITLEGKVTDAEKSVMNVPNLEVALSKVMETELGDIARSKDRNELVRLDTWTEDQLKDVLNRAARPWGFEVVKSMVEHNDH
jgi:regulator of protease activity HflC (stomatin/prohibitin superfamily)